MLSTAGRSRDLEAPRGRGAGLEQRTGATGKVAVAADPRPRELFAGGRGQKRKQWVGGGVATVRRGQILGLLSQEGGARRMSPDKVWRGRAGRPPSFPSNRQAGGPLTGGDTHPGCRLHPREIRWG